MTVLKYFVNKIDNFKLLVHNSDNVRTYLSMTLAVLNHLPILVTNISTTKKLNIDLVKLFANTINSGKPNFSITFTLSNYLLIPLIVVNQIFP